MSIEHLKALEKAITDTLQAHADEPAEKGVITGWVLVVESFGTDGVPYTRIYCSPNTPPWRDLGLVRYAVDVLKASIFARR